jgi:hypothetical protein
MGRRPIEGYPWEDVYIVSFIERFLGDTSPPLLLTTSDPLDVSEVWQALVDTRQTGFNSDDWSDIPNLDY